MAIYRFLKQTLSRHSCVWNDSRNIAAAATSPRFRYYPTFQISRYSTSSQTQKQLPGKLQSTSRVPLPLLGVAVVLATVSGYFIYHSSERQSPIKAKKPEPRRGLSDALKTTLGGPFRLINNKGEEVTDQSFIGHWNVIYFGYTSCPEDCPEELEKLAQAVEKIGQQIDQEIVPIFITIDPRRDNFTHLQAYISEFHPKMVGLTGSADDIRQVAREYRVFYKKVEEEQSDYLVDHSSFMYLMDPNMEFVKLYGREYNSAQLSSDIVNEIMKRSK